MTEIWKEFREGLYISNMGRIVNDNYGNKFEPHLVNGNLNRKGYNKINYKGKRYRVARLVGLLFIDNPENKPTIDHINKVRNDDRAVNLRWATYTEQQLNKLKKNIN